MTYFHCQSAEMRKTGKGGKKNGSKKKVIKGAAKSNVCDRKRFCCDMTHTHAKVGCCHIRSLLCRTNQPSIQHVFISTLNLTAKAKHTRETIHTKEQNKSLKRINYVRKKDLIERKYQHAWQDLFFWEYFIRATVTMIALAIYFGLLSIQRTTNACWQAVWCRVIFNWGAGLRFPLSRALGKEDEWGTVGHWLAFATVSMWIHPDQSSWRPCFWHFVIIAIFGDCLLQVASTWRLLVS